MEEMLYVVVFTFFSLPVIFTLVANSISHFLTAAIKFSCYSSNETGLLCFFSSGSSSFSVVHANVDIKLSRMKDSASLLLFFISKGPGGCAIYRRNARVSKMQNFTPAYLKGEKDVQPIFSEPKFLGCIDCQIFLPTVLR